MYSQERTEPEVSKGHRRRFHWLTPNGTAIVPILKGMLPYLIVKKEQAELCLQFFDTYRPRFSNKGIPLTDDELILREQLAQRLRESRHREWAAIPKYRPRKIKCQGCGIPTVGTNSHKKFCSARCSSTTHMRIQRARWKAEGLTSKGKPFRVKEVK